MDEHKPHKPPKYREFRNALNELEKHYQISLECDYELLYFDQELGVYIDTEGL